MVKISDKIEDEIKELEILGNKIYSKASNLSSEMKGQDLSLVSSWVTRLGQLI